MRFCNNRASCNAKTSQNQNSNSNIINFNLKYTKHLLVMTNIQLEGLEIRASKIILDDLEYIQDKFNYLLNNSEVIAINNVIKETKVKINLTKDNLKNKSYYDKYLIFNQISESWFDLHEQCKSSVKNFKFVETIDNITNYSIAYSKLFLSLYLINEDKVERYKDNFKKIVSGFLLLSETIDVFIELFSIEELEQINYGVENAISISKRDITEYVEEELEISNLVTQMRAYSSLIILKIKEINNSTNNQKDKYFDLESQLKAMAEDPEIQSEINAINEEFLVTEMDGLN